MEEIEVRPNALYVGGSVVGSLALMLVIRALWSEFPIFLFVVVPAVLAVQLPFTMVMRVSSNGLTLAKRSAAWEVVVLTTGRFGETLRTRRGQPRHTRLAVFMPYYELNWRTGRSGACVAKWAPHLLERSSSADDAG